jgi:DNA modification methylase
MIDLRLGDCLEVMPTIPSGSVDAVISDPIYPEIDRPYGRISEAEWHDLMRGVVAECRRILKPSGSAVFILQPNSERVGRMRPWLFEFQAWTAREWNMVQDAWWWNTAAIPEAHAIQGRLMRPSVKACVWLGSSDCYRDQDSVLWDEAETSRIVTRCARARNAERIDSPSGHGSNHTKTGDSAARRGGVTPFNLIPTTHGQGKASSVAGSYGHPAGTPLALCDFWVRYIVPPNGVVLDPFCGIGTIPLAARRRGRHAIGIEKIPKYFDQAKARLDGPPTPLFDPIKDSTPCDPRPALLFS